jgi:hypothetical protein
LVSAAIDHMVSITIFLAALLLFINLFSQTNQTAVIYEQHRAVATKCSDLLDNMLLNPGSPSDWGQSSGDVTGFGVQDPDFTEYQASPFSLMRLAPYSADTVVYDKTANAYYSSVSTGFGSSLLMSKNVTLNYSLAQELLGIDNSYGFQLTLTPTVNVSVVDDYAQNFLRLNVTLSGTGFPLANAALSYELIPVSLPLGAGEYPSYTNITGTGYANGQGFLSIPFQTITDPTQCFAFIAYAHLSGLVGVGYHLHVSSEDQFVVPIVEQLSQQGGSIALAHNYDLNSFGPAGASLKYNATFVLLSEGFTLREMSLPDQNTTGTVFSGVGHPYYPKITLPANTTGILIVTYQQADNATKGGVVVMPWGISALAFPVTFGDNPLVQEWVATDMRQVIVNHVSYQAKLMLWSSGSQQVMG